MENTKTRYAFFALSILVMAGFVSCGTTHSSGLGLLPPATLSLVQNAVFEVVWEKPVEDPVVYEKNLNWDLVPYKIRNDKYYSIGTAFAISQTELITAFHVINLGFNSMSSINTPSGIQREMSTKWIRLPVVPTKRTTSFLP